MPGPDHVPRLKAQLRLAINRLRLTQEKKSALTKMNRRSIVPLLEAGKIPSARIRIENIIQEDIHLELLELLEVYCELLLARVSTIDQTLGADERVKEAVYSVIYAAPYSEIKELQSLRALLGHVLAKETYADAADNLTQQVPHNVVSKIFVGVPSDQLVTLYLTEIAKAYETPVPGIYEPEPKQVVLPPAPEMAPATEKSPPKPKSESDSVSESPKEAPSSKAEIPKKDEDDLWARFAALKK